jgi:hypothetical protein
MSLPTNEEKEANGERDIHHSRAMSKPATNDFASNCEGLASCQHR